MSDSAREYRRDGPNAVFSSVAAGLGIRCKAPCLDPASGAPVADDAPGAHEWTMAPHATLLFYERAAFVQLGEALARPSAARDLARLWRGVDSGRVPLKEVNGELERFAGLVLAWLNGYERACERPHAKRRVFVSKVRGFTFGGAWHEPGGRAPDAQRCEARRDAPPCFRAAADGCAPGHAWPPNMTRPVN